MNTLKNIHPKINHCIKGIEDILNIPTSFQLADPQFNILLLSSIAFMAKKICQY